MSSLEELLRQSTVRDAFCALVKRWEESIHGLIDDFVRSEMQEKVLPALGGLPKVTADDLLEAFRTATGSVSDETPDRLDCCFRTFCECLDNLADHHWYSEPAPVGPSASFEWYLEQEEGQEEGGEFTSPIWCSGDDAFSVFLVAQLPVGGEASAKGSRTSRMYVQVKGICSRRFFDDFSHEAAAAVAGFLHCVNDLFVEVMHELANEHCKRSHTADEIDARFDKAKQITDLGPDGVDYTYDEDDKHIVAVQYPLPYSSRRFLEDGLAALFADAPKRKDTIARRLKNAIRLTIESQGQSDNAIGLALSVTAIEALVCRKRENLTQMFVENMAALLEPNLEYRHEAEQWSKELYGLRSGVLHGSDLECSAKDIRKAQVAAGMVLRAMLERRAAIRRVGGDDENPEEFLRELKSGKYVPGQLTHVSELPLKRFWREDAPKRIE